MATKKLGPLTLASVTTTGIIQIDRGLFNVSLYGTWVATLILQRSFDGGANWLNVKTYNANIEDVGEEPEDNVQYRLNCTVYTSGTVTYIIGQVMYASYR